MSAADLARERYVSLATFRRNGAEVRTPIWFALGGGGLWMVTGGDSGKVKRLRRDPRVRVAPCNARGAVHGPWQEGTARITQNAREAADAHVMLRDKYGWQVTLFDFFSRLSGRAKRRVWLEVLLK